MSASIRRVGILTGGGDCPGLNAVIRAVTKTAINQYRLEVVGIEDGFLGLVENRMRSLDFDTVSGILTQGGTILGTNNKVDPTRYHVDKGGASEQRNMLPVCLDNLRELNVEALIVIGGDGTMSVAGHFVEAGVNCIGVPKTIDNDLVGTDVTFGFNTAVATATDALDRIHTTAASHHRVMVVELMGRNAGWLALYAGVASGADIILIPEIPYDMDAICRFIDQRRRSGRRFSIVSCSEGARAKGGEQVVAKLDPTSADPVRLGGVGQQVADQIAARTGQETRTTVLGHVQRGGSPIADDRVLATEFGHAAVQLLMAGAHNRLVVMQGGAVSDIALSDVVNKQRLVPPDHPLVLAARHVGTCFGDLADPAPN